MNKQSLDLEMGALRIMLNALRVKRAELLTPQKVNELAQKRLKKLIELAIEKAPFYRKLYSRINPDDFDIKKLPPTNKEMLMENFEDTLTVDDVKFEEVKEFVENPSLIGQLYKGKYVLVHTSGTTGIKGYFVYSKKAWEINQAIYIQRSGRDEKIFPDVITTLFDRVKIAIIIPVGGHYASLLMERVTPKLKSAYFKTKILSILDPIDRVISELNEFQPDIVHSYPTYMEKLAFEKIRGKLKISPQYISVASETLTRQARTLIEHAFGVKLINYYGTTECVQIAFECEHRNMHVHADWVFLEPVDEDDNPLPPNVESHHVLVTNLYNPVQPIIRYRLDDVIVWKGYQNCPCGRPLPVIEVIGRAYDNFWVIDKSGQYTSFAPIGLQVILIEVRGLYAFQMIQEERNRIRMLYVAESGFSKEHIEMQIKERLSKYFKAQNLEGCIELVLENVSEIPRDPKSGKVKLFYSKVGIPSEVLKA